MAIYAQGKRLFSTVSGGRSFESTMRESEKYVYSLWESSFFDDSRNFRKEIRDFPPPPKESEKHPRGR